MTCRPRRAAGVVLADLEHVFRIPGNPVRLRAAERQREPHLPDARRRGRRHRGPVDRGAAHRTAGAAHHRLHVRSHLELARAPPAVFPRGRRAGVDRAVRHAALADACGWRPGLLWVLDASINIAMEPFRAFVARPVAGTQRPAGYSMQSFFIGVGAVVASLLPWMLAQAGVSNVGTARQPPCPTRCATAFDIGAVVLMGAMLWTIADHARISARDAAWLRGCHAARPKASSRAAPTRAELAWCSSGSVVGRARRHAGVALRARSHAVRAGGGVAAWGAAAAGQRGTARRRRVRHADRATSTTCRRACASSCPCSSSPGWRCSRCGPQTTAAVTRVHFGATDTTGAAYNEGANWVGVLFARVQRLRGAGGDGDPAAWCARFGHPREPSRQSVARRRGAAVVPGDPRSGLAAAVDGGRGLRLGVDPVAAVRAARRQRARRARWACTWASSISSS